MKSPWLGALAAILSLAVAAPVFAQTGTAPAPAPAQVPGPDLPGAVAMLQLYNPSSKPTPNTLNAYLRVATTGTRPTATVLGPPRCARCSPSSNMSPARSIRR